MTVPKEVVAEIELRAREARSFGIQRFVVGAAVVCDQELLVLVRAETEDFLPGYAEIPGGKAEPQEQLLVALSRELLEETGLHVARVSAIVSQFDYLSRSGMLTRQFNFLVQPTDIRVHLNPAEHSSFLWLSAETDLSRTSWKMSEEMVSTIRAVFEELKR